MAGNDKAEVSQGLIYKGKPLIRKDNTIYYGSMSDKYIIMLQILETKEVSGLELATKVSHSYSKPLQTSAPRTES